MDLPVDYKNIADESLVQRDGTVKKFKRFDFYLGKFGPFVERFELETFTDAQLAARIVSLKSTIQNAPR
jgi:topoisomerase IA-like protein